jgi:D-2-hydroxyacid dehydrogenase (NADP+)
MRILVIKREASQICSQIAKKFPAAVVEQCNSSAELEGVLSRFGPDVALAFKFGGEIFPSRALMGCPTLKWVHSATVGVDHLMPWDSSRIEVTNSAGVHDEVLANYVIGAILSVNTHFFTFREQQTRRIWKSYDLKPTSQQRLTVIGYGRIGSRIGRLAKTAGMAVTGVRTQNGTADHADRITDFSGVKDAVADADFVAVTLPLTQTTRGLIDKGVIDVMRKGSWLINISRGSIVDESALKSALEREHLGGAFVDVFSTEPLPESSELWTTKNLYITPHTGDAAGWEQSVLDLFNQNLKQYAVGEKLKNSISLERGY